MLKVILLFFLVAAPTIEAGFLYCREINYGRCVQYVEHNACIAPNYPDPAVSGQAIFPSTGCNVYANSGCANPVVARVTTAGSTSFAASRSFKCD